MAFADSESYTDAQLLAHTRKAIAAVTLGGKAVGFGGQALTRADLPDLWDSVDRLEKRIADASPDSSGGIGLAGFGERR